MKLYHAATSVCSQKVRVGMAELGLDYDSEVLDLQKGDQFDPDYMALNPDAVVPTLVDNGLVIVESSLILEYLDREYNGRQLMPSETGKEVAARHWLLRTVAVHAAINTLTFSTAMRRKILAEKSKEQIAASLAKMPDPVMRKKRQDLFDKGLASPYLAQALMYLRRTFEDMAAALVDGSWVSGSEFGIVDIALIAYLDRLDHLCFDGLWKSRYPALGDWLACMRARPSYETGIASHIPAGATEAYRKGGSAAWPELERLWIRC